MRTRILGLAVALCVLTPVVVVAQDHTDVVRQVKTEMGQGAFVSTDAMLSFVIRVLDRLPPSEGLGLVKAPPGGENVAFYGPANTHVRVNRVIQPNGQIVKILTDSGPGGENGPAWNMDDVRPDLYIRYMPSVVVVVPPPPPIVVPPPPPVLSVDYTSLLARIVELQQVQILKIDESLLVARDTNATVKEMNRTFVQTLGSFTKFAAKYIAPAVGAFFLARQFDNNNAPAPVTN